MILVRPVYVIWRSSQIIRSRNWIINVNYLSTLHQVDFYLVSEWRSTRALSGWRKQRFAFLSYTGHLEVTLDSEQTYQVYLFVKAKRICDHCSVRLMSGTQHQL